MTIFENPEVAATFDTFPTPVADQLVSMRATIIETADAAGIVLEESLKWGQPSYKAKKGSPLRLGVHQGQAALFFHCQTTLIETFRELFGDRLNFEGNRAISFSLEDPLPLVEIRQCIMLALTYHRRKNLHLLGAQEGVMIE